MPFRGEVNFVLKNTDLQKSDLETKSSLSSGTESDKPTVASAKREILIYFLNTNICTLVA